MDKDDIQFTKIMSVKDDATFMANTQSYV